MDRETLERRCPRLGGTVSFSYCRTSGENGSACFKVFDCWWERFDVSAYMRRSVSKDEFRKLARTSPKPKLASILELIEQAKQNTLS